MPVFLTALAGEAEDALLLLSAMERSWFAARQTVAGRRRNSRAAAAVDLMTAAPLISATSLAAGLGMAVKNAASLLDGFCAAGLAVEVTHRSKRRLFGLAGLALLREAVAPPRRPEPGRGRGRPPVIAIEQAMPPPLPEPPFTPIERRQFDYSSWTPRWPSPTRPSAPCAQSRRPARVRDVDSTHCKLKTDDGRRRWVASIAQQSFRQPRVVHCTAAGEAGGKGSGP